MNKIATLTPFLSVAPQLDEAEFGTLAALGYKAVINNRPDGESADQPAGAVLEAAARRHGLAYRHVPVVSGRLTDDDVAAFAEALSALRGPVLAFCRTGTRSATLWALSEAARLDPEVVLRTAQAAGYDLSAMRPRLEARWEGAETAAAPARPDRLHGPAYDVVVVGGGAAGISVTSSLLRRKPGLSVAIIEPSDKHYYQPGWTLVGAGEYPRAATERPMERCMPKAAHWIRAAAAGFEPEHNQVVLEDGGRVAYRTLIVCPGIKLDWGAIDGLAETLGRNGVTCNYAFDMAAYTWELVRGLRRGRALFHPAADADQVRRCAAESDVPVLRSLVAPRCAFRHRRGVQQRRRGPVRRGRIRSAADAIRAALRRQACFQLDAEDHRRAGEDGLVRGR